MLELDTDERQLMTRPGSDSTDYLLLSGDAVHRVGRYRHHDRVLEKRHDPEAHAHRRRRGTGVNLELVVLLDRLRPQPAALELLNVRNNYRPRRLPWATVVAYAGAALAGDVRWLIADDVDRQVLIPYAALNGLVGPAADVRYDASGWAPDGHRWAIGPPPPRTITAKPSPRLETPAPPTLFEDP